jgi:hypothetical protein
MRPAYELDEVLSDLSRRRSKLKLFRLMVGLLIVAALGWLVFLLINKPEDARAQAAAESFIIAMQSNDPDKAYAMGNESFRTATSEERLDQLFDQIEPFVTKARIDRVDSYYATSNQGEPRAILVYAATKNSKVTYIRIVMDKQKDSAWKVHSLITKAQPLQAKPE